MRRMDEGAHSTSPAAAGGRSPTLPAPAVLPHHGAGSLARAFRAALAAGRPAILGHAAAADDREEFARSVDRGLGAAPPRLDCRFLYDAEGSRLYEAITALDEYYLTRTEAALLARHADELRRRVGPATLVELGSGSSAKTPLLLDAWARAGRPVRYVPVDVSASALAGAFRALCADRPWLQLVGLHATHEQAFPLLRTVAPALVVFLGSSVGNLDDAELDAFLAQLAAALGPGDHVLLGADLVKDPALLEAAYDDAAGVTAAFTRNLFARMNRELGAGLDVAAFAHEARWEPQREQIEIHARVLRDQVLALPSLGRRHPLPAGTRILVEICRKFRLETLSARLRAAGFATVETWTDPRGWFALLLLRRTEAPR